MALLKSAEDTYPLFQLSHLQPPQGCVLRLFDPLELALEEIELELLVSVVVFELVVHADIAVEPPVPVLAGCLLQSCVGHGWTLEELQEPMGRGQDHVVVIAIVIGGRVDLLNPGDFIRPMLLGKPRDTTVRELFDPVSRLPHPILDRDSEAWASSITVEYIPFWTLFGR
jgi:hypothetical protein